MSNARLQTLAMVTVAASGLIWGLFWIPLRALDQAGISGMWAIALFHILPTVLLLPLMGARWRSIRAAGWPLHVGGVLAGAAMIFYAGALVYTDVVRALLFYYLTPIWSSLLARLVLGEAITRLRWGTIALGALGLSVLLDLRQGLALSINTGDLMGLAAGLVWAAAAVFLRRSDGVAGLDYGLSYFCWGSLAALALLAAPFATKDASSVPTLALLGQVLPWMVPVALILIIPPSFGAIWGATLLSPGLVGILFMTEISAGTLTASWLTDEPFGPQQIAGVILITSAGVLEPLRQVLGQGR